VVSESGVGVVDHPVIAFLSVDFGVSLRISASCSISCGSTVASWLSDDMVPINDSTVALSTLSARRADSIAVVFASAN